MPIRGEVSATLSGGRKVTLVVNFATIAKAAVQCGFPPKEMLAAIEDEDDPRQYLCFLSLIQQSMQKHHRGIDEDEVSELIASDLDALRDAFMAAQKGAFVGGEAGEAETGGNPPKAPRKAKTGTGTRSSGRGRKRT